MKIEPRKLHGTFEISLNRIGDSRGYFLRTYSREMFAEYGMQTLWTQENQSLSTRLHTIRGLHFQKPPFAETKLVRVVQGTILDVFVDLRTDSPTFGQWDAIELSEDNDKAIYIPRGFGHGFATLTQNVIVQYKVDNSYNKEMEGGIKWNDADIGIEWGIDDAFTSERDQNLPSFKDFNSLFTLQDSI